jgi:N-acylneuraminate cytidylyltransferase
MVSTESQEIADLARKYGASVPFLRPAELASDTAQLVDVCDHVLVEYEARKTIFQNFCILWATAPMRTDRDIVKAFEMLDQDTDAVVSITEYDLPVFCAMEVSSDARLSPLFPDFQKLPSSRQPKAVVDNSSLCWVKVSAFKKHGTWLPPRLKGYEMPRSRSVDVDDLEDWELAEFYYKRHLAKSKKLK